jgi:uncharacterized protein (TIGR03437 family)
MKSMLASPRPVSRRPTRGAAKLTAVLIVPASMLFAQPTGARITTISVPTSGQVVFDAVGYQYYMRGPVTIGSAQPQPGGGTCADSAGGFGPGVIYQPCSNAQVVKVDPAGNVVFGTYLGGQSNDSTTALAVDSSGNTFLTGHTGGQFPTTPDSAIPSSTTSPSFAARLSSDGSAFLYVTYLPAGFNSAAIALDTQDNAYITGQTNTGAAGVVKLSPDGSAILYNIVFAPPSSSGNSNGTAITIDPSGNTVVAGWTASPSLPVTSSAIQSTLAGAQNLFLVKLDPSGNVIFATYFGGSGIDAPIALQTDSAGSIYLAGTTTSLDFPITPGTFEPTPIVPLWNNQGPGGFALKLNPSATRLAWSTYIMSMDIGGVQSAQSGVRQLAVTPSGDVYLGGVTGATFPVTPSAPEVCFAGSSAGFVAHLNPHGALADATYLNAPSPAYQVDSVYGLAANAAGQVQAVWQYLSGYDVESTLQFGSSDSSAAACLSANVLNAASMTTNNGIAAGELITLTGFGIGPVQGVSYTAGPNGQIPMATGGVQVLFGSTPAPVLYASSTQINAIAPTGLTGSASITVTYNNQQFGPITAPVTFASPGFFRRNAGYSIQAAAVNEDGTINSSSNPAAPGSIVSVWATGYGVTNPSCTSGELNVPESAALAPGVVPVNNGGVNVTYVGSAPDSCAASYS